MIFKYFSSANYNNDENCLNSYEVMPCIKSFQVYLLMQYYSISEYFIKADQIRFLIRILPFFHFTRNLYKLLDSLDHRNSLI
jgi:hypothetical protein